jgi:hypothetical protein
MDWIGESHVVDAQSLLAGEALIWSICTLLYIKKGAIYNLKGFNFPSATLVYRRYSPLLACGSKWRAGLSTGLQSQEQTVKTNRKKERQRM